VRDPNAVRGKGERDPAAMRGLSEQMTGVRFDL